MTNMMKKMWPALFLWYREQEDGAKVVRVENINNPYKGQQNFDKRFKLTLNKLYAWSLVEYDRVVMLDADNLFLQKTDELFQCGQFCAVFINPCIFHTGLFVLQVKLSSTYDHFNYFSQSSTSIVVIQLVPKKLLSAAIIRGIQRHDSSTGNW